MKIQLVKIFILAFLFGGAMFWNPSTAHAQEVVQTEVDQAPIPPGGMEGFIKFMSENLTYPEAAKKAEIEGTVVLTFIVQKDGSIQNVEVLRGIGGGCDEEAVRLVKSSPQWTPAKKDNENVDARMRLPIRFKM